VALAFILPPALGRAKAEARAELVKAALRRELGEPVSAYVASSYGDLEERILTGRAHLAWAPAGVTAKLPAARAVFTIVREGQTSYRSALVARRESALTLANLAGTRAAWVDPLSAGGYLLAAARLRAEGLDPERTFAQQAFLGSHRAAIEAVLHASADVTAVSMRAMDPSSVAAQMRWYAGPAGDWLTPIAFTESCLNDAIVLAASLSPEEAARIATVLVAARPGAPFRSRFLSALEADGLSPTALEDYQKLLPLLTPPKPRAERRSVPPPSRQSAPPPPTRPSYRPPSN
jgi:phosphonate transport system substrate-binding protein